MIALTVEIGPELKALLTPLVVALGGLILYRKQQREFRPNGGTTLRDAVDRIELSMSDLAKRVGDLEDKAIPLRRSTDQQQLHPLAPTPEA